MQGFQATSRRASNNNNSNDANENELESSSQFKFWDFIGLPNIGALIHLTSSGGLSTGFSDSNGNDVHGGLGQWDGYSGGKISFKILHCGVWVGSENEEKGRSGRLCLELTGLELSNYNNLTLSNPPALGSDDDSESVLSQDENPHQVCTHSTYTYTYTYIYIYI